MQRHKVIPAIYLLIEKEKQILLQRRYHTGYKDGEYGLVSGHVDQGEPAITALIREAEEEIGIKIKKENVELIYTLFRKSEYEEERLDLFFKVNSWAGDIENKEPNKCDDLQWFDKTNLPNNTITYINKVLQDIKQKINYGEWGW